MVTVWIVACWNADRKVLVEDADTPMAQGNSGSWENNRVESVPALITSRWTNTGHSINLPPSENLSDWNNFQQGLQRHCYTPTCCLCLLYGLSVCSRRDSCSFLVFLFSLLIRVLQAVGVNCPTFLIGKLSWVIWMQASSPVSTIGI